MNIFKKQNQTRKPSVMPKSNTSKYNYSSKRVEVGSQAGRQSFGRDSKKYPNSKPNILLHLPALIILVLILCGIFYSSTLNSSAKIKVLSENKNITLRDQSVYQQKVDEFIRQSVLNRSKLLFDSQGLTAKLKQEFPEIAGVGVNLPLLTRQVEVKLQLTKPSFILDSKQNLFLIGNNGVALLKASDIKDLASLNLLTVTDQSTLEIELGKPAIPKEQVQFMNIVVEQLQKQGFELESLTIPTNLYDLHIKLKGLPYYLKLNILEDPKQQVGSFIATKQHLDKKGQGASEYIDLRVGERVFYK